MEQRDKLVVIEVEELEAIIERVVERKLSEALNSSDKRIGENGRWAMKDVMEHFKVSKQTIYNWLKDGKLPQPARIGRRLYWTEETIKGMLP